MIISELFEAPQQCPECGGISFSDLILAEKKDACYHKVKASAKVWPSAYASGRLVQCRKKGAANYGYKSEGVAEGMDPDQQGRLNELIDDYNLSMKERSYWEADSILDKITREFGKDIADQVDQQGVAEASLPGQRRGPLDLPPLEGPGSGGGSQVPQFRLPIIPDNMPGGARMPGGAGMSRNIATQRSVGGKEIPRLGKPGNFVPGRIDDKVLYKLGGKTASTTSQPTVTVQKRGSEYEPLAADVPAYVRKGLPDPVTVPKPGTKPKITVRPGETVPQAMQRTRDEQEFSSFLKGQGGQSFGTSGAGRGGQGGPTAAQTSGSNQVPTVTLPGGQTIPDPARLSPSGQYNTQSGSPTRRDSIDKIERDDKTAVDAMANRARQGVIDREARAKKQSDRIEPVQPKWKNRDTDIELEEASRKKREKPEVEYDDEYDAMVARVKRLAGLGPMKTVYDPAKRQYRNMPTAVQPKK